MLPNAKILIFSCQTCYFVVGYIVYFSIFYKMKLPVVLVLNKNDIADTQKLKEWIKNYEKFEVLLFFFLIII